MVGAALLSLPTPSKLVLALTRTLACKIPMLEAPQGSVKASLCHNNTAVNTAKTSASLRDPARPFKRVGLAQLPILSRSRAVWFLRNLSIPVNRRLVDTLSMVALVVTSAANKMPRVPVMAAMGQTHSGRMVVPMAAVVAGTTELDYHCSFRDASESRQLLGATMAKHICFHRG